MIYLDSSVLLARVLSEATEPADSFWTLPLTSSRLLLYEVWNRIHARNLGDLHQEDARLLLARVRFVELSGNVLARALDPLPRSPKTLDTLHLATMGFLRRRGHGVTLASYDHRLLVAASAMGIAAEPL
ncbi:MAG TPA: PIN domain-containing protein [Stellaceae bacterium]|nr:PIN domain-containing protein [Stellaceae bacterium]